MRHSAVGLAVAFALGAASVAAAADPPPPAARVTILYDAFGDRPGLGRDWGFSALIEVLHAGRARRVLFDAGVSADGVIANLDRLALAPDSFEAIVLSG